MALHLAGLDRAPRVGAQRAVAAYLGGAQVLSPLARALSLLAPPATEREVTLEWVSSTSRYVWTPVGDTPYWLRWRTREEATGMWSVIGVGVYLGYRGWVHSDPSVAYTGAWSTASTTLAFGGGYRNTGVATRAVEFTVTGVEDLHLAHAKRTSGGLSYVTIDGGTDLVNELPLDGGNRVLNHYAAVDNFNVLSLVASGLDPEATYTVRMTAAGVNGGGSGTNVYFAGWATPGGATDSRVNAPANSEQLVQMLGDVVGVWGYAISYVPPGAAGSEFTGLGHGNELAGAIEWVDGDGDAVTVDSTTKRAAAARIVMRETGTARHSETGTTDHADVLMEWTFHARGADCYHRHEWTSDVSVRTAYPAMFTCDNSTTRGQVIGDPAEHDLTNDDGAILSATPSRMAVLWNPAHQWVPWLYLPDLEGVADYAKAPNAMWIQDRDASTQNKIYAERVAFPEEEAVTTGTVWTNTAHYRVSQVADPAAVLPVP